MHLSPIGLDMTPMASLGAGRSKQRCLPMTRRITGQTPNRTRTPAVQILPVGWLRTAHYHGRERAPPMVRNEEDWR
jgi:hypothetical protein